jgi:hypothetical protein
VNKTSTIRIVYKYFSFINSAIEDVKKFFHSTIIPQ